MKADFESLVPINDKCYVDKESHIIAVQFDRITFSIYVDEFLDFFNSLQDVKDYFSSSEDYVIGTSMQGPPVEVILPKPLEEECS